MSRSRRTLTISVFALALFAFEQDQPAAIAAPTDIPLVFAQAVRQPTTTAPAKKAINRTTDLIIRGASVLGLTILLAACSYFGLYPWLLRSGTLPLDAFAIATMVATSSFFLLTLGLWWNDLQFSFKIGGGGWTEHLLRLSIILLMFVVNLGIWGYNRSRAKAIRAGH